MSTPTVPLKKTAKMHAGRRPVQKPSKPERQSGSGHSTRALRAAAWSLAASLARKDGGESFV